jgi:hypothetical protein
VGAARLGSPDGHDNLTYQLEDKGDLGVIRFVDVAVGPGTRPMPQVGQSLEVGGIAKCSVFRTEKGQVVFLTLVEQTRTTR